jgi:O-antigen/teichoic acid export membrane protein
MLEHAVGSGTTFLLMIVAARMLGPSAFGLFALMYMLLTLFLSISVSLVDMPHNIIGATKQGYSYQRYTSSAAILVSLLATSTGLVFAGAALVAFIIDAKVASMLLATAFATVSRQLFSFTRGVLYTESRIAAALFNSVVINSLRMALLVGLVLGSALTEEYLFIIIGGTYLLGALIGARQIRGALIRTFDPFVISENWQFGRWILAKEVVGRLPMFVTPIVMTSVLSVGAYGAYRAFSQLIQGAYVPVSAVNNVLRPRLARDAQIGPRAVWRTMFPIMVAVGAVFSILAVLIIVFRVPILSHIFGVEYAPYATAMFLLMLTPIFLSQNEILAVACQAVRRTDVVFVGTLLAAIFGTGLGSLALILFGLPAAGAAGLIGALISFVWLGYIWKQHMNSIEQSTTHAGRLSETSISQ